MGGDLGRAQGHEIFEADRHDNAVDRLTRPILLQQVEEREPALLVGLRVGILCRVAAGGIDQHRVLGEPPVAVARAPDARYRGRRRTARERKLVSNSDVKVAVNWDSSNNLIYEVAINKKEFFGDTYSSKDEEGNISLEVEVNGLPHYDGEKVKAYHSDGMQAGMGDGKQGGSNRGGFNQENMPQQSTSGGNNIPLSAKTSFKQKFVLNNGSN